MKAETVLCIGDIFDALGWPTDDIEKGQFPNLFSKFCRMCSRLNNEQRDLILAITPSYQWLHTSDLEELFLPAWKKLIRALPKGIRKLAIVPLLRPSAKQPKSSGFIWYFATSYEQHLRSTVPNKKIVFCQDSEEFLKDHVNTNTALILLDDYVGSGNTTNAAIMHLLTLNPAVANMSIFVVSIAAQHAAFSAITHPTCRLICQLTLFRGISDNTRIQDKDHSLRLMESIETMLGIPDKYKLGYQRTQALVTLTKTPNNTFPVFWTDKKVDGQVWDSPFTRPK